MLRALRLRARTLVFRCSLRLLGFGGRLLRAASASTMRDAACAAISGSYSSARHRSRSSLTVNFRENRMAPFARASMAAPT